MIIIDKTISIEELITALPESVSYLMRQGIKCIACGDPIWGTLESASKEKGFNEHEIEEFVRDLNNLKENKVNN